MQCPLCLHPILEERHSRGIEVDVCPNCGGIWLDRGELERLVTQAQSEPELAPYEPPENPSESTEEHVPRHEKREVDDDEREAWTSDRRSNDRHDDDDGDDDDGDDDDERKRQKKTSGKLRKSWGDRLEDVLDDVLDLDDLFD